MERSIVSRLTSALQNRDSLALLEMFDPHAEIRDPLIGVVRRKYARYYSTVPLIFFNKIVLEISDVTEKASKITARWRVILTINENHQKKIESTGSIVIELREGRIYTVDLDFNYWRVLGNLFGLKGYILGSIGSLRKKIRRKAINQIKELLPQEVSGWSNHGAIARF